MDEVRMPKAAYEALMEQISTLQAMVERLQVLLKEKDQIILNLNRARFGQSSEKRTYLLSDGQLSMFEQAGEGITEKAAEDVPAAEKKEVMVGAHTRKPKRSMEELVADLPEETVVLDLPEGEKHTKTSL
ncbi:MAG: transposase domain-containing protein [Candidatus Excrementavichristensenella sp.]